MFACFRRRVELGQRTQAAWPASFCHASLPSTYPCSKMRNRLNRVLDRERRLDYVTFGAFLRTKVLSKHSRQAWFARDSRFFGGKEPRSALAADSGPTVVTVHPWTTRPAKIEGRIDKLPGWTIINWCPGNWHFGGIPRPDHCLLIRPVLLQHAVIEANSHAAHLSICTHHVVSHLIRPAHMSTHMSTHVCTHVYTHVYTQVG